MDTEKQVYFTNFKIEWSTLLLTEWSDNCSVTFSLVLYSVHVWVLFYISTVIHLYRCVLAYIKRGEISHRLMGGNYFDLQFLIFIKPKFIHKRLFSCSTGPGRSIYIDPLISIYKQYYNRP